MNFRVFRSDDDLREALSSEILRIASLSPAPYLGLIGHPSAVGPLLDTITSTRRIVFAGYPDELDELIRSRPGLEIASQADLIEPLDLVIVIGDAPAATPPWLEEARGILLAPANGSMIEWARGNSTIDRRSWIFALEDLWRAWQPATTEEDE